MKLESLCIKNFRACKNIEIKFGKYTCLVGPNGAGKSTVLAALNVLFRNTTSAATDVVTLKDEDFYDKDTANPIIITATFTDLSPAALEDLKEYARHGKFILSAKAVWDENKQTAEVYQIGYRMGIKAFAIFFEAYNDNAKKEVLVDKYSKLCEQFLGLPSPGTKDKMAEALWDYEKEHVDKHDEIESRDQFYGFTKGAHKLPKHIQWVYIPAVKDASEEQNEVKNSAFGQLLQRTVRSKVNFDEEVAALKSKTIEEYSKMIDTQQLVLDELSSSLQGKLQEWAHPGAKVKVTWNKESTEAVKIASPLARAAIGENNFVGEVARLGHGLQRAFLVTVLHELATKTGEEDLPKLLLGFEEPELYQHPPQARHLAGILEELENAQLIVTTHSPYFISGEGFENVRLFRRHNGIGEVMVSQATHNQISERIGAALGEKPATPSTTMAKLEQILQPSQSELFFCAFPVLVEGVEDVAYISTYLQLLGLMPQFRRMGGHFVVCAGKTNISRPLAIALDLGVPHFVVFDADSNATNADDIKKNKVDNNCILKLCSFSDVNPLSSETIWKKNLVMWTTDINKEIKKEINPAIWDKTQDEIKKKYQYGQDVNKKNPLMITAILEHLFDDGIKSKQLEGLCKAILDFGESIITAK